MFPDSIPDREAYILAQVRAKNYQVDWTEITSLTNHLARFWITADALKVEGVRVNCSATLQQQIADVIGAFLLTPKLADLLFIEADVALSPMPRPITANTAAMIDQSQKIDQAIAKALGGASAKGKIVQTVGKHWCLGNSLLTHPGRAMNYGWHFRTATFGGSAFEAVASGAKNVVTGQVMRLIQGQGWAHDSSHVDYSQNCCLVRRDCLLDGNKYDLQAILTDPNLSQLASHEGPLKILRQPGVAVVA